MSHKQSPEQVQPIGAAKKTLTVRDWSHKWSERTLIMGIVNVTPDSFSGDGVVDSDRAVAHALHQIEAGADMIDLGAESTRPGHKPVSGEEEMHRLLPVLKELRRRSNCLVSVDTTKSDVLKAAVAAGADILNSIWGLTDELLKVVRDLRIPVVLMHNKERAFYDGDVVQEVVEHLACQAEKAMSIGIGSEQIILDPGIGFGKTAEHNILVLQRLSELVALGYPTLIGTSRKSFIGKLTEAPAPERQPGTTATVALAISAGVDVVRVHDVQATVQAARVTDAIVRNWRPKDWSQV